MVVHYEINQKTDFVEFERNLNGISLDGIIASDKWYQLMPMLDEFISQYYRLPSRSPREQVDGRTAAEWIKDDEIILGNLGPVVGLFGKVNSEKLLQIVLAIKERKAPVALMLDPLDIMRIVDRSKLHPSYQQYFVDLSAYPDLPSLKAYLKSLPVSERQKIGQAFRDFRRVFTGIHLRFPIVKNAQLKGKSIPEAALSELDGTKIVQAIFLASLNPEMSIIAKEADAPVFGTSANEHNVPESTSFAQARQLQKKHRRLLAEGGELSKYQQERNAELQTEIPYFEVFPHPETQSPQKPFEGFVGSYPAIDLMKAELIREGDLDPMVVQSLVAPAEVKITPETKKSNHGYVKVQDQKLAEFIAKDIVPINRAFALTLIQHLQAPDQRGITTSEGQQNDSLTSAEVYEVLSLLFR